MKASKLFILILLTSCFAYTQTKLFQKLTPKKSGIEFRNDLQPNDLLNTYTDDYYNNGGGVGVGDLNNDGLPDIVLIANQLNPGIYYNKGDLKFKDVTKKVGVSNKDRYCTGVNLVDINNDGWLDIYISVAGYGFDEMTQNMLWVNNKGKSFEEKAADYNLNLRELTNQVVFFDFDKDGDLDMYSLTIPRNQWDQNFHMSFMQGVTPGVEGDKLYIREGDKYEPMKDSGTREVETFFGLGVMATDLNDDGWTDLYVCNDYNSSDFLYHNQQGKRFRDDILQSTRQTSNNSMGLDINDYDNDLHPDIMVVDMTADDNRRLKANMSAMNPAIFEENIRDGNPHEYMFNTLQKNNGNETYSQVAFLAGVATTDWSWAPLFGDYDNDADKDLFITNGIRYDVRWTDYSDQKFEVMKNYQSMHDYILSQITENQDLQPKDIYKKLEYGIDTLSRSHNKNFELYIGDMPRNPIPNYAFKNNGGLKLQNVSSEWGLNDEGFTSGAAFADFDLDGDLDLVVNNSDDFAVVYKNNTQELNPKNYIRLKFKGSENNILGYNTKAYISTGDYKQYQELSITRGFLSAVEPILHFGLADANKVDSIEIIWSDNKKQILTNVDANQVLEIDYSNANLVHSYKKEIKPIFTKIESERDIEHVENDYDDYVEEVLLPHQMSTFGPGIAVADINGDLYGDLFLSASRGSKSNINFQYQRNITRPVLPESNIDTYHTEDQGALFFDADGDGDKDLYVVSGSNEYEEGHDLYIDRFYINDSGNFKLDSARIPDLKFSGSCVIGTDFDKDGDIDLFVGGRQIPRKYPFPASSRIYRNDNGFFVDVTEQIAPELINLGMVTTALWTDYDNDGDRDLMIAGEWMPIKIFENVDGNFKDVSDGKFNIRTEGWWWSLQSGDFDQDGDMDYVAGNLGLNYKYEASQEFPFIVYSDDFDHNGTNDIVLSYYENGVCYPLRGRSCSSQQIPDIKKKFPSYNLFSQATVTDVYGDMGLQEALTLKAYTYASSYIENQGDGTFIVKELPEIAQISTMFGILPFDFDGDGNLDILTAGNMYNVEVETPRADASIGLLLKGDGSGNFNPIPGRESGFVTRNDTKGLVLHHNSGNDLNVLVANNNSKIERFDIKNDNIIRVLPASDKLDKLEYFYKNGTSRTHELHYGSGYMSQSSRVIVLTKDMEKVVLRNFDGTTSEINLGNRRG